MTQFKAGDKVICIGTSVGHDDDYLEYGGAGWEKGRIFIIDHINDYSNNGRYVCWPNNDSGVWSSHLALYEKPKKIIKPFGIVKFMEGRNVKND